MDAFEIDLDSECVWLDDAWLNRDDLVRKIKGMIDAGEYQIARPSQALETLTRSLAQARLLALRINPEMSDALNAAAQQTGRPVGAIAREAIAAWLANAANSAAPQPLTQVVEPPVEPIPLMTESASPEEAADAVPLTPKKSEEGESEPDSRWYDSK
jgi:hypothetical protein